MVKACSGPKTEVFRFLYDANLPIKARGGLRGCGPPTVVVS